jgi:hypothetical protein
MLSMFVTQQACAQKLVSKVASIVGPSNAIMLSYPEAKTFEKSHFKSPRTMGKQFIYRIDNILIGYYDHIDKTSRGINLDRVLVLRDNMLKRNEAKGITVLSQKRKYPNAVFVLHHFKEKDDSQTYFISESRNGKSIIGHIRYKNTDSIMARNILDVYLNNFTFLKD